MLLERAEEAAPRVEVLSERLLDDDAVLVARGTALLLEVLRDGDYIESSNLEREPRV